MSVFDLVDSNTEESAAARAQVQRFAVPEFQAHAGAKGVLHGFFGRQGGVSRGVYDSLNCGVGSDDEPESVMENRRRVQGAFAGLETLLSLYQVHGAQCLYVSGSAGFGATERPQADAFVSDQPGIGLGILTADCAPVLFAGVKPDGGAVVGAAHAGWGGAFKGVLEVTLERMAELGAARESIAACIGPCIGEQSYEVGAEFRQRFTAQDPRNEAFFHPAKRAEHYRFDLRAYCAMRLGAAGVGEIYHKDLDTYFNEADFFSYRRATHRGEKDYGRQISVIGIAKR